MKATDLMCGDWVLINGTPHKIQAIDSIDAEILADNELYYIGENKYHSEDKIEGIPITPEILKKNDWYWGLTSNEEDIVSCVGGAYDEHWVYDEGAGEISLFFPKDTDGGVLKIDDQGFNRHLEFVWCDTLYVHELQHALRLCGLNELADSFQIQKDKKS